MSSKRTWQIIGIGLLLLAFVAGLFAYTGKTTSPASSARQEVTQTGTVSITIEGLYTNKSVPISENATVLGILQTMNTGDSQLQLSTKEYSGLGTLVDGMHGNKNGTDKKYWQYKVNGVMPQIGADAYVLKGGDSVEWYFGESTF
ncbi:MAG: DUF4430 domain-containing protein [bacterium]|nr:DUF4430 domain-containing protein [bacterium]